MDVKSPPRDASQISCRSARLLQSIFNPKKMSDASPSLIPLDGLLDGFSVLYSEFEKTEQKMTSPRLKKPIQNFLDNYKTGLNLLRSLRVSPSDFEKKQLIGKGHFAEIYMVKERNTTNVYAMKVQKKYDSSNNLNFALFQEERDILSKANSPWLTQLHYAFQDADNLYLVMDYHHGGDLFQYLSKLEDVEEEMTRFYLAEVVLAVHALHLIGYVHRDIKPENILFDRSGHVKLVDFGAAVKLGSVGQISSHLLVGTPDYIAPEVLEQVSASNSSSSTHRGVILGTEVDFWSVGVLLYEMIYGRTPFSSEDDEDSNSKSQTSQAASQPHKIQNILNYKHSLHFSENLKVSSEAISLIRGLLISREDRLDYSQVVQHAFFCGLDFSDLRNQVPPYLPVVKNPDDTSNFDPPPPSSSSSRVAHSRPSCTEGSSDTLVGRDLPFVGFTFTKLVTDGGLRKSLKSYVETHLSENENLDQCVRSLHQSNKALEADYNKEVRKMEAFKKKYDMNKNELLKVKNELDQARREIKELNVRSKEDREAPPIDLDQHNHMYSLEQMVDNLQNTILTLESENSVLQSQVRNLSSAQFQHPPSSPLHPLPHPSTRESLSTPPCPTCPQLTDRVREMADRLADLSKSANGREDAARHTEKELNRKIATLNEQIVDMKDEKKELLKKCDKYLDERLDKYDKLKSQEALNKELHKKIDNLEVELSDLRSFKETITKRDNQATLEIQELQKQVEAFKSESTVELKDMVKDLQLRLRRATMEKEQCLQEAKETAVQLDSLRGEVERWRRMQLTSARAEEHALQLNKEVDELRQVCSDLQHQLEEYRGRESSWNQLREEHANVVRQRDELKKQAGEVDRSKTTVNQLQSQIVLLQEAYKIDTNNLKNKIKEDVETVQQLHSLIREMDSKYKKMEATVAQLSDVKSASRDQIRRLKEECSEHITACDKLKADKLSLLDQLFHLENRVDTLESTNADLELELQTVRTDYAKELYRMEETSKQQAKLIDYMQESARPAKNSTHKSGPLSSMKKSAIRLPEASGFPRSATSTPAPEHQSAPVSTSHRYTPSSQSRTHLRKLQPHE